jgi:hypothetical protein
MNNNNHEYNHGLGHPTCFVSRFKSVLSSFFLWVFLSFCFLCAYISVIYMKFGLDSSVEHVSTNWFHSCQQS